VNARYELLLLRHAEAKPAALDEGDFQRPLTAGGCAAALTAAKRLSALPWCPQRLLYSSALRTQQTAAVISDAFRLEPSACIAVPELYLATPPALRTALQMHHGSFNRLMIVGHNPGLSEWGAQLAVRHADESLPTAGYWLIDFAPVPWLQLVGT
jgi:phosphohistidine phosphatase